MDKNDEEYIRRRSISFAQAEGRETLPYQLKRDEITPALRAKLWQFVFINSKHGYNNSARTFLFSYPWSDIYRDLWVDHLHGFADKYERRPEKFIEHVLSPIFKLGDYVKIYSAIQFIIRHPLCPAEIPIGLQSILQSERSPFRVVNSDTLCPVASTEEINAVINAVSAAGESQFVGARSHLLAAAAAATSGAFADSARESIHAVESVARSLSSKGGLAGALAVLESKRVIHRAMKTGFSALYGYTSDEEGIRHPLLEDGTADVNEADALFMLGACASFVSYMISRAREAGLIGDGEA
ncbi:hypothetical protein [Rhodoblastus sp.]|uniref:AbiJ-NTD4 domain-containing protein n=1 Tax=Rhodoblastus sp. TaxID=1962975 RepID=UPI002602AB1B|nr:hypothetical protein [Rhodoblastus sp.]